MTHRLRDYQTPMVLGAVEELVENKRSVLASLCVSSGKTLVALSTAAVLLARGVVTHVVVIAPSDLIVRQFEEESGMGVALDDGEFAFPRFERLDLDDDGKGAILDGWLRLGSPSTHIVCSMQLFARIDEELLQHLGDRLLLVVDESHRVPGESESQKEELRTQQRVRVARRAGARLLKMTGTPYRHDGRPVRGASDEELEFVRPLADHMAEGYTPRRIHFERIEIPGEGVSDTFETGDAGQPKHREQWEHGLRMIAAHMLSDGKPKSMLRLKNSGGGPENRWRVDRAMEILQSAGLTVADCTGIAGAEVFADVMRLENREPRCAHSVIPDVVIIFSRGSEGANLPSRSHMYMLGCPHSMVMREQLLGRIVRKRITVDGSPLYAGTPSRWLDESKVVVAVSGIGEKDIAHTVMQMTLRIASLDAYAVFRSFFDGIQSSSDGDSSPLPVIPSEQTITRVSRVEAALNAVLEATRGNSRDRLTGDHIHSLVTQFANQLVPSVGDEKPLKSEEVNAAIRALRLSRHHHLAPHIRERVRALIETGVPPDAALHRAMAEVFEQFMAEAYVAPDHFVIDGVMARYYGSKMKGAADRNGHIADKSVTTDKILGAVAEFRLAHQNAFPKLVGKFGVYDRVLREAHTKDDAVPNGLPDFLLAQFPPKNWRANLHAIAAEVRDKLRPEDPSAYTGRTRSEIELNDYRHHIEMAYYRTAIRLVEWIVDDSLSELTLPEAAALGAMRRDRVLRGWRENGVSGLHKILSGHESASEQVAAEAS